MAALIASFVASLILGVGFAVVALAFGNHFVEIAGSFGRMAIFSFGTAITACTYVFDDSTIGLMRGGLQLTRNTVFSIAKMALLPACGLVLHDMFGVGITLAWVLGTFVSLVPVIIMIKRDGTRILHRPDWKAFRRLGKVTLAHNWLNLAVITPPKVIPVLVVLVVSPSDNAAFYMASMLTGFLTMVPTHLSTVLFAVASAAPEKIGEKLRFVLRTSLVVGIPGGLVMGLASHLLLSIFGSGYASAGTGPLWLLIIGYIPEVPNTVYIAVCRASGRMNQAAIFLSAAAAVQMVAVLVGGKLDGLYGVCFGMLAVAFAEALVTTPPILRAAFGSAPARSAADEARTPQPTPAMAATTGLRLRQEAGVAALVSLASTMTGAQPALSRSRARHRLAAMTDTRADRAVTDTSWWPDADEQSFRARQEAGVAALIAIATHGARL